MIAPPAPAAPPALDPADPGLDRALGGSRAARKARGVYYTPPAIVDYIVAQTLGPLLSGKTPAEAAQFRILDPACGSGLFLVAATKYLLTWYETHPDKSKSQKLKAKIVQTQIFGVDIDPRAVALARQALGALAETPLPEGGGNLCCGDALLGPDLAGVGAGLGRGLDWGAAFPAARAAGGFDVVLGNPPWVSLKGRFGNGVYTPTDRAHLARCFGGDTYRPNIYEYFVQRAVALTRPGGYQAFLVPDRLATNAQFTGLRRWLLAHGTFIALRDQAGFPGVIADTLVYIYRPGVLDDAHMVAVGPFGGATWLVAQACFRAAPDAVLRAMPPLIARLYAPAPQRRPLGTVVATGVGFIAPAGTVTETPGAGRQPVLKGRHIQRYATRSASYFAFATTPLAGGTHDPAKLGARPKILLRKTGLPLAATLDASGRYPEQSLYFLHAPGGGLDLAYILGILNSRLFQYVYATWMATNRASTPQLKKIDLDQFPLPVINFADPADATRHAALVAQVQTLLAWHGPPDDDPGTEDAQRRAVAVHEAAIDRLVYALYDLTGAEIAIVEARTAAPDRL